MSARREKRLRSLERRVAELEAEQAARGYLRSNAEEMRERLKDLKFHPKQAGKAVPMNAWWCRTPTDDIPQDAEYQQVPHRTVRQRIKDFFMGGNQE